MVKRGETTPSPKRLPAKRKRGNQSRSRGITESKRYQEYLQEWNKNNNPGRYILPKKGSVRHAKLKAKMLRSLNKPVPRAVRQKYHGLQSPSSPPGRSHTPVSSRSASSSPSRQSSTRRPPSNPTPRQSPVMDVAAALASPAHSLPGTPNSGPKKVVRRSKKTRPKDGLKKRNKILARLDRVQKSKRLWNPTGPKPKMPRDRTEIPGFFGNRSTELGNDTYERVDMLKKAEQQLKKNKAKWNNKGKQAGGEKNPIKL